MKFFLFGAVGALSLAAAAAVGPAPEGWKFGTADTVVRHDWPKSVRWLPAKNPYIRQAFATPQDWSAGSAVAFWVHAENAPAGAKLGFEFSSENPATPGPDYYGCKLPLDWSGWKTVLTGRIKYREES